MREFALCEGVLPAEEKDLLPGLSLQHSVLDKKSPFFSWTITKWKALNLRFTPKQMKKQKFTDNCSYIKRRRECGVFALYRAISQGCKISQGSISQGRLGLKVFLGGCLQANGDDENGFKCRFGEVWARLGYCEVDDVDFGKMKIVMIVGRMSRGW